MEAIIKNIVRTVFYISFFLIVLSYKVYAFNDFAGILPAVERVAFARSLKFMSTGELEKLITDNIVKKAKTQYNFIVINELLERNNERAYNIVDNFLAKPQDEIFNLGDSPYLAFDISVLKIRSEARGDINKLAILFGEKLKQRFNFNYLWLLADLRTSNAVSILENLNAITPNEMMGKAGAIIINKHGYLPAKEFVILVLDRIKNKITNNDVDFSLEEWIFSRYASSNPQEGLLLSKYLQEQLAINKFAGKTYLSFLNDTIKHRIDAETGKRYFNEKVSIFSHNQIAQKFIIDLQNECKAINANNYFHSPLHHLINNCAIEKVTEAVPQLFLLVDFTLDPTTDHEHPKSSGVDFFPAAKALIALRPPASVILQAMQAIVPPDKSAGNEPENGTNAKKRLQLLTWILYQIEENDAELVKFILQRKINNNEDKNGSLVQALKLLEKPDELLPQAF